MQIVLYDLRKNKYHKTQKDMADYLGISTLTYRDKEKGKKPFNQDEMFQIALWFDLRVDEIFLPRKAPERLQTN